MAVLALCSVVAACGDDSKPSASAASSSSTEKLAAKPTGTPIKLGMITRPVLLPLHPQGAEAAIARINADGGVNGHPLELVVCSNEDKGATAGTCAQKYAADPAVIATVGDINGFGADANPALEQAKIAGIGTSPLTGGDFGSPRVFPNNSGGQLLLGGVAFAYDELKARKIGLAMVDTPTTGALPGLIDANVLKSRGTKLSAAVPISTSAADVSSQAAALVKSDAVVVFTTADLAVRMIKSLRQQGYLGPIVISETSVNAPFLQSSLSATEAENLYAMAYFDKTSAGYQRYRDDMKKYEPKTDLGDSSALAWLAVNMFADVASKLPSITREAVYDAMGKLTDYDTGGMTAPLDFTKPGTVLGGKAPRLFEPVLEVYIDGYKDGEYHPYKDQQKPYPLFS